jgi:hypothetical protein
MMDAPLYQGSSQLLCCARSVRKAGPSTRGCPGHGTSHGASHGATSMDMKVHEKYFSHTVGRFLKRQDTLRLV